MLLLLVPRRSTHGVLMGPEATILSGGGVRLQLILHLFAHHRCYLSCNVLVLSLFLATTVCLLGIAWSEGRKSGRHGSSRGGLHLFHKLLDLPEVLAQMLFVVVVYEQILALECRRSGGLDLRLRMLLAGRLWASDDGVEERSSLVHVIVGLVQHLGSGWP